MHEYTKFYIDGAWVDPVTANTVEVENPGDVDPEPSLIRAAYRISDSHDELEAASLRRQTGDNTQQTRKRQPRRQRA